MNIEWWWTLRRRCLQIASVYTDADGAHFHPCRRFRWHSGECKAL